MAVPTNRDEVAEYALRRLGDPVIQINVSDDQVDDRIDDALALFYEDHYDGTEKYYLKHQITDEDKTNGYITVPDNIVGAIEVFPLYGSGGRVGDIFDIQYQIALNDLYNLTTVSLVPYVMTMTHLNVINELLVGKAPMRYTRSKNRIYIDTDWNRLNTGDYLLIDCYQIIDPTEFADVYKDRWFLAFVTALIKEQWGQNLSKLDNIQLPGGVILNGRAILADAKQEIADLREELRDRYRMPPLDMFG